MFSLSIALGSGMWALLYRTEEKAREAVQKLGTLAQAPLAASGGSPTMFGVGNHSVDLTDDFGQELTVMRSGLSGFILENMKLSKAAYCERVLHQQHIQIEAQKLAAADATIRTHRQMQGGPPVFDPTGLNGGYRPI